MKLAVACMLFAVVHGAVVSDKNVRNHELNDFFVGATQIVAKEISTIINNSRMTLQSVHNFFEQLSNKIKYNYQQEIKNIHNLLKITKHSINFNGTTGMYKKLVEDELDQFGGSLAESYRFQLSNVDERKMNTEEIFNDFINEYADHVESSQHRWESEMNNLKSDLGGAIINAGNSPVDLETQIDRFSGEVKKNTDEMFNSISISLKDVKDKSETESDKMLKSFAEVHDQVVDLVNERIKSLLNSLQPPKESAQSPDIEGLKSVIDKLQRECLKSIETTFGDIIHTMQQNEKKVKGKLETSYEVVGESYKKAQEEIADGFKILKNILLHKPFF